MADVRWRAPRSWRRAWLQLTAFGALVVVVGNALTGLRLGPALGAAVVASAAVASLIQVGLAAAVTDDPLPAPSRLPTPPPASYVRLRQNVRWATNAPPQLSEQLHRTIRALTADRLATAHGVDLTADSQQAQALLGPELWAVVTATGPPTGLDAQALDRLTRAIGAL